MSFFRRIFDRTSTAGAARRRLPVRCVDCADRSRSASAYAERFLRRYAEREQMDETLTNFPDVSIDFDADPPPRNPTRLDLDLLAEREEPVWNLLHGVLLMAVRDRASHIYLEPFEGEAKLRMRRWGALQALVPPPRHLVAKIASCFKEMAKLDLAETRRPQQGLVELSLGSHAVDLRVDILPTRFGESVSIRFTDHSEPGLALDALGMSPAILAEFRRLLRRRNGLLLSTGPGGSGKTTTQYAALRESNQADRKIITIEDPVEFPVPGLTQVAIDQANGLDFPEALQAALRQAPDVLFVAELRDLETAQATVQAALASQLVLSSVHTPDAVSAITRLSDMGVPLHLVASSVSGIVAQRLVRTICSDCRTEFQPSEELLGELRLRPESLAGRRFYRGDGCTACGQTGYKGRSGLFELVSVDDDFRDLIFTGASTDQLRRHVRKQGVPALRQAGLAAVFAGSTTIDEIVRETVLEDAG
jgi:type IV pilus assembly protein PilB